MLELRAVWVLVGYDEFGKVMMRVLRYHVTIWKSVVIGARICTCDKDADAAP